MITKIVTGVGINVAKTLGNVYVCVQVILLPAINLQGQCGVGVFLLNVLCLMV